MSLLPRNYFDTPLSCWWQVHFERREIYFLVTFSEVQMLLADPKKCTHTINTPAHLSPKEVTKKEAQLFAPVDNRNDLVFYLTFLSNCTINSWVYSLTRRETFEMKRKKS